MSIEEVTPPAEQLTTLRSNAIGLPGVLLGIVIYFQFVPLPAAPFNLVGPIDAAWLVLGIIVVVFLSVRSPRVLHQGTRLFAEEPDGKEPA